MIKLSKKDGEVNIELVYSNKIGGQPTIAIHGVGDNDHHLIEGLFDLIDRLASMEKTDHQSEEWIMRRMPHESSVIIKI